MATVKVVPRGGFSRDLSIRQGRRCVATVGFQWLTGTAKLVVAGQTYTIRQHHRGLCSFVLQTKGKTVARAQNRRTLFHQYCTIDYGGSTYRIEGTSALGKKLVLREGAQFVGYMEPEHAFTRRSTACLPDCLPLAVQVFVIVVAIRLWMEQ